MQTDSAQHDHVAHSTPVRENVQKQTAHSWRKTIVAGVGFLSDAYDLFIINIVVLLLKQLYKESSGDASVISTAALAGAVIGMLVFGTLADKIGRTKLFLLTLSLVIAGSLCSAALSFDLASLNIFIMLAIWRFMLGLGIGGEYPLSATITAEGSTAEQRGRQMALVFSMQGVGILLAALFGWVTIVAIGKTSLEAVWRVCLAFGGVPGLATFYFRWKLEESEKFQQHLQTLSQIELQSLTQPPSPQHHAEDESDGMTATSTTTNAMPHAVCGPVGMGAHFKELLLHHKKRVVGTAVTWFLFDIVFYANGLFSATIIDMSGAESLPTAYAHVERATRFNVYLALLAIPGYWVAVVLVDRVGRKKLQSAGLLGMAILYVAMGAALQSLSANLPLFLCVYGLSFFFANAGPNAVTYILPAETFPTHLRATGNGLAAAAGKLGAVLGAATMSPLLEKEGLGPVFITCGVVAFVTLIVTIVFVDETMNKELAHT